MITLAVVAVVLLAFAGYFIFNLNSELKKEKDNNEKYVQLAEMDKKEMENEYQQFANQYSEMKTEPRTKQSQFIACRTEKSKK